jgi:hypothetical protein
LIVSRLHRDIRKPSDYSFIAQRWNPALTGMLYCAANVALCCLEVLVHTDGDTIPDNYVWSYAELSSEPEVFDGAWDIGNLDLTRWYGRFGSTVGDLSPSKCRPLLFRRTRA